MELVTYVALVLIGVCFGSFAGAMVWRLRAAQLVYDKKHKEQVDTKELNKLRPLTERSLVKDRSVCLHCGYELKWYDLIPIASWLSLKGKCRQCRKAIGIFELAIEVGVALFFVVSYIFWPFALDSVLGYVGLGTWLAAGVIMAMLAVYDAKWYLLPDRLTIILAILGALMVTLMAIQSSDPLMTVANAAGAVLVMSGLYYVIHRASKGKWVGFGDVKLGVGLGLLLTDWQLALIALFIANLIGTLIVVPLMISGKVSRSTHVPFGPLLIAGTVITFFIGPPILLMYAGALL